MTKNETAVGEPDAACATPLDKMKCQSSANLSAQIIKLAFLTHGIWRKAEMKTSQVNKPIDFGDRKPIIFIAGEIIDLLR